MDGKERRKIKRRKKGRKKRKDGRRNGDVFESGRKALSPERQRDKEGKGKRRRILSYSVRKAHQCT